MTILKAVQAGKVSVDLYLCCARRTLLWCTPQAQWHVWARAANGTLIKIVYRGPSEELAVAALLGEKQ